jgi:dTDP-4-dehydrorhamnose reductase
MVPEWTVIGLTRPRLDLTDSAAVQAAFQADRPGVIIHCAALSRSVVCEADPRLARQLNVEVTACLADLAAEVTLIFLSTDLVFDGKQGHYRETDTVNPVSVYGESKAAAERIVLANPRHCVLRTSLNFGCSPTGDRSFNEEMRRAWEDGRTLRLFTDEFRCPIPAEVTARFTWEMTKLNRSGLYHLAGAERLSRWEIGRLVAASWPNLAARIEAGSVRDFKGPPRSPDTSLDCSKIQPLLSAPLPCFSAWLSRLRG